MGCEGRGGVTERGSICVYVPEKWRLMCACAYVRVTAREGVSVSAQSIWRKGEKNKGFKDISAMCLRSV